MYISIHIMLYAVSSIYIHITYTTCYVLYSIHTLYSRPPRATTSMRRTTPLEVLEAVVHAGLGAQVAHRPAAARVACGEQEAHLLRLDAHARRAGPADLWPLRTFHLELEAGPGIDRKSVARCLQRGQSRVPARPARGATGESYGASHVFFF